MITVTKNPHADTRSCDYTKVTPKQLEASSFQHIVEVRAGLGFFQQKLEEAGQAHDTDKLTDLEGFHHDFVTGMKQDSWLERHYQLNRHHLMKPQGTPVDVNLIDVLDFISDMVMARAGRGGRLPYRAPA